MDDRCAISRRLLLRDLGGAALGIAVVGLAAACGPGGTDGDGATSSPTAGGEGTPTGTTSGATADAGSAAAAPVEWHRVDLDFVSAYVLVRGGEAAVVDTGVEGSAGDIEAALSEVGLGWGDVGHVVLTHRHPDHVGSLGSVLGEAPAAAAYAGAADIEAITSPRELTAVGDGDVVFGLRIIETPGHTPGHVSVFDPAGGGLLVAGDALNGADTAGGAAGEVVGANPEFSEDMDTADASVRKLADFDFDTALFGHGEPVEDGAAEQVRALASSL